MQENLFSLPLSFYVALITSLLISLLIIFTKHWHIFFSLDSMVGVQKIHLKPTPRIGGTAVFAGVVFAYFVEKNEHTSLLGPLILAGLSAFIFGLAEDATKQVSIATRLFATTLAGVVGWAITGISLTHIGISLFDSILKNLIFSVFFTAIAIGGIANAINMIDGLNGLASSMMIIALTCLALIAHLVGDVNLAVACLTVGASIFGFFLINWPWGKLFMGDGGSYFCGFALAWSCVLLVERNPLVSPFAGLLICIYPFSEAMFSIFRRVLRTNGSTEADLHHLHSLIYRRYSRKRGRKVLDNSIAGLLIGVLSIPPAICAYYFYNNNFVCAVCSIFFMITYLMLYRRIVRFNWM